MLPMFLISALWFAIIVNLDQLHILQIQFKGEYKCLRILTIIAIKKSKMSDFKINVFNGYCGPNLQHKYPIFSMKLILGHNTKIHDSKICTNIQAHRRSTHKVRTNTSK